MKNRRKVQIVTVLVLTVAAGIALGRKAGWRLPATPRAATTEQSPQAAIYAMLDAARAGDVKAYLASYTGPMEAALRQTIAETTEPVFAKYLQESNTSIKGVAISDPQKITDEVKKVRVEYVYQDRNEAQMIYLERGPGGWKISRSDSDERVKTLVPYGTPVK
jgi:hypothetical protein